MNEKLRQLVVEKCLFAANSSGLSWGAKSVNPISTRGGGRLCPPNNSGTLGFSDLPTALIIGMDSDKMCEALPKIPPKPHKLFGRPTQIGQNLWDTIEKSSYLVSVVREFKQEKESRDKRFLTTKLHAVNLLC